MKIFFKGFVENVRKAVNVFSALSDYEVSEIDRYFERGVTEEKDTSFVVSIVSVSDDEDELPFNSLDDSAIETICKLTNCTFLTSL